jgi:hypothetical protein
LAEQTKDVSIEKKYFSAEQKITFLEKKKLKSSTATFYFIFNDGDTMFQKSVTESIGNGIIIIKIIIFIIIIIIIIII